ELERPALAVAQHLDGHLLLLLAREAPPGLEVVDRGERALARGGEEHVAGLQSGALGFLAEACVLAPVDDVAHAEGEDVGREAERLRFVRREPLPAEAGLRSEAPLEGTPAELERRPALPARRERELDLARGAVALDLERERAARGSEVVQHLREIGARRESLHAGA